MMITIVGIGVGVFVLMMGVTISHCKGPKMFKGYKGTKTKILKAGMLSDYLVVKTLNPKKRDDEWKR